MKFSEAILAGCKVSKPRIGGFQELDADGNLCMCATGAAVLGAGLLKFCPPAPGSPRALGDQYFDRPFLRAFDDLCLAFPDTDYEDKVLLDAAMSRYPGVKGLRPDTLAVRTLVYVLNDGGVPREEIAAFLAEFGY